jgi:hypothetical protein
VWQNSSHFDQNASTIDIHESGDFIAFFDRSGTSSLRDVSDRRDLAHELGHALLRGEIENSAIIIENGIYYYIDGYTGNLGGIGMRFMKLFSLAMMLASCVSLSNSTKGTITISAFREITLHKDGLKVPLGGNFSTGATVLSNANPFEEANEVFSTQGATFVALIAWLAPPGIDDLKLAKKTLENKEIIIVKIPATGDVIPIGGRDYHDAAWDYAARFNRRMLILSEKLLER